MKSVSILSLAALAGALPQAAPVAKLPYLPERWYAGCQATNETCTGTWHYCEFNMHGNEEFQACINAREPSPYVRHPLVRSDEEKKIREGQSTDVRSAAENACAENLPVKIKQGSAHKDDCKLAVPQCVRDEGLYSNTTDLTLRKQIVKDCVYKWFDIEHVGQCGKHCVL